MSFLPVSAILSTVVQNFDPKVSLDHGIQYVIQSDHRQYCGRCVTCGMYVDCINIIP